MQGRLHARGAVRRHPGQTPTRGGSGRPQVGPSGRLQVVEEADAVAVRVRDHEPAHCVGRCAGRRDALQAKLYRALAEIPGIRDDGLVDDGTGRQVRAIRWDQGFYQATWPDGMEFNEDWGLNARRQILLDPDTYRFRGVRWIEPELTLDNKVTGMEIILDVAVVDERGQRH